MQLSLQNAQRIIDEIGGIVKQKVNIIDERGFIIASTDESRVGQFHEGASRVIKNNLPELYITPEESTISSRAGLNLPIRYHGEVVGVIGLTGEYEQVSPFGKIVQKMTELLIQENIEQKNKRLDRRVLNRFLEDWVLGNATQPPQVLAERGVTLGVDITKPRRVMVISVRDIDMYTRTTKGQKLLEQVEKTVEDFVHASPDSIIFNNTSRQIALISGNQLQRVRSLAQEIVDAAGARFGVRMIIGIDDFAQDVHKAYTQANKAWRSTRFMQTDVLAYQEVLLELFLSDISTQNKKEYLYKVFANCEYAQMKQWVSLLEAYFAHEGAIGRIAQELFIHKNTLQYKLNKLQEVTGYDVRKPSHSSILYMAVLFFKEVENSLAVVNNLHNK